jgi:hypothetical protein
MSYIVIDRFDINYPNIVVDMESGMPLIFDSIKDAQVEADDCQDAIVIEI